MIFLSWRNYSKLFNLTEYYPYIYIYIYIYMYFLLIWIELSVAIKRMYVNNSNYDS